MLGYDESPGKQTGSHDLVLGQHQGFTGYADLVGGYANGVTGSFAAALGEGGSNNQVTGIDSSTTGGFGNRATGTDASITGGEYNLSSDQFASISGGCDGRAGAGTTIAAYCASTGIESISGGRTHLATGTKAARARQHAGPDLLDRRPRIDRRWSTEPSHWLPLVGHGRQSQHREGRLPHRSRVVGLPRLTLCPTVHQQR